MTTSRAASVVAPLGDRMARGAERALRMAGDARLGLGLLLLTGAVNAVAALLPAGPRALEGLPYALLLGALALSGLAAIAVRAPVAWREWRRPGPVTPGQGAIRLELPNLPPDAVAERLAGVGYRVRIEGGTLRWALHAVRRGWSRFAGVVSHGALLLIVLGAAIGAAFGSETTFTLFRGDQALLDAPRPGFTSAVRLDRLDAEFGPDDRPRRLDTDVTFLRDGADVERRTLRVNEPGDLDGYLVHPWTYGPAVRLRVATLGGTALLDAPVPLDDVRDGVPVGSTELPTAGVTLGLAGVDLARNELAVSVVGGEGLEDTARLRPGERARVGDVEVELLGFDAWVTFLARRDPGVGVLFLGAAALSASLAVAFWLPRRRVTVRRRGTGLELVLRGERFDHPADEGKRLAALLRATP